MTHSTSKNTPIHQRRTNHDGAAHTIPPSLEPPRHDKWWLDKLGMHPPAPTPHGTKPAPPTAPKPPSHPLVVDPYTVFHGHGMLTAWYPTTPITSSFLQPPNMDLKWVALNPRFAGPAHADLLKSHGFRIIIWEDQFSSFGYQAVRDYEAVGYIGQVEGPGELPSKLALAEELDTHGIPKCVISNVTWLPDNPNAWDDAHLTGWGCIPEAYENVNPNARPDAMIYEAVKRGAVVPSVCFGLYPGADEVAPPVGSSIQWPDYVEHTQEDRRANVCGYLAETYTYATY